MESRRIVPLLVGLFLIGLGSVLLAANLGWVQLQWLWLLKFIFPAFFLFIGASKLVRHFTWTQDELAARPMKSSLLGGLFWSFLGAVLLIDIGGGPQTLTLLGDYWPGVLILFGLGKIIDFYRLPGRFQVRAAEVFGLVVVIIFGVGCNRLADTHFPLLTGGSWWWPLEIESQRHRFEADESFPINGVTSVEIGNLYGDVRVEPGTTGVVQVELTSVVREENAAAAQQIADRFGLRGSTEGAVLRVATNRSELGAAGKQLHSHLVVRLPAGMAVTIRNGFGDVSLRGLRSDCRVENDYGRVSVSRLEGNLVVTTTRRRVEVRDVSGTVKVTNRRGSVRLESIRGPVEVETSYEPLEGFDLQGDVVATNRLGSIRLEGIGGTATVNGTGSRVQISRADEQVSIRDARRVTATELGGALSLQMTSGEAELARIAGRVEVQATQTRLQARDLEAGMEFTGEGTQVALRRVRGPVRIVTTLRDVRVDDFSGSLEVRNEFGAIHLEAGDRLSGPVVASNRNGEINVVLPSSIGFELSARSEGGRVVSEFGEPAGNQGSQSVVRTTVGEGGPRVDLQTTHSRIRVRSRG